jgi:hypothetical protein
LHNFSYFYRNRKFLFDTVRFGFGPLKKCLVRFDLAFLQFLSVRFGLINFNFGLVWIFKISNRAHLWFILFRYHKLKHYSIQLEIQYEEKNQENEILKVIQILRRIHRIWIMSIKHFKVYIEYKRIVLRCCRSCRIN